jgi:hypothetical protein
MSVLSLACHADIELMPQRMPGAPASQETIRIDYSDIVNAVTSTLQPDVRFVADTTQEEQTFRC